VSLPLINPLTGRVHGKSNPYEKSNISGTVADIITKFTRFTDEDSFHISYKFH